MQTFTAAFWNRRRQMAAASAVISIALFCAAAPADEQPIDRVDPNSSVSQLVRVLKGKDSQGRLQAIYLLGKRGRRAEEAIPALIDILKAERPKVKVSAAVALLEIEPELKEGLPIFLQAIKRRGTSYEHAYAEARRHSNFGMFESFQHDVLRKWDALLEGEMDPEILEVLAYAQAHQDKDIRVMAALFLGEVALHYEEAVPMLAESLEDKDLEVRVGAIYSFQKLGPKAEEFLPQLNRFLTEGQREEQAQAAITLSRLQPEIEHSTDVFVRSLEDSMLDTDLRAHAAYMLGNRPDEAGRVVPRLIQVLDAPSAELRLAAELALIRLDSAASPMLLETLTRKEDQALHPHVIRVLNKIDARDETAKKTIVPKLIRALARRKRSARYMAVESLKQLGEASEEAVPELIWALRDPETSIRSSAAEALVAIGPAAVPALGLALKDDNGAVRMRAAQALKKIGTPEALKALEEASE